MNLPRLNRQLRPPRQQPARRMVRGRGRGRGRGAVRARAQPYGPPNRLVNNPPQDPPPVQPLPIIIIDDSKAQ